MKCFDLKMNRNAEYFKEKFLVQFINVTHAENIPSKGVLPYRGLVPFL